MVKLLMKIMQIGPPPLKEHTSIVCGPPYKKFAYPLLNIAHLNNCLKPRSHVK